MTISTRFWQDFNAQGGVVLLGGGPITSAELGPVRDANIAVHCADGGYFHARDAGLRIDLVVGDLDTVGDSLANSDIALHRDLDENSTDFEKLLAKTTPRLAVCFGFTGGRFDHSLASINAIAAYPNSGLILVDEQSIMCLCPSQIALDLPVGGDIGLFPMHQSRMRSEGLRWEVTDLNLSPLGQIATSNKVAQNPVELRCDEGAVVMILPKEELPALVSAFRDIDGQATQ